MKRRADPYKGKDPRDLPAYTPTEAAHYLHLAPSTVRAWCFGQQYTSADGQKKRFNSILHVADTKARLLSFKNLVELHVLSALRRDHRVTLEHIRRAVRFVEKELGGDHPLVHQGLVVDDKRNLLVEALGSLVNVSQDFQVEMEQVVREYLSRVERDGRGIPIKLFPVHPGAKEECAVEINPLVKFGRPCLKGRGIPVDIITERFLAGEKIPDIANDYDVKADDIEAALRFTTRQQAA